MTALETLSTLGDPSELVAHAMAHRRTQEGTAATNDDWKIVIRDIIIERLFEADLFPDRVLAQ